MPFVLPGEPKSDFIQRPHPSKVRAKQLLRLGERTPVHPAPAVDPRISAREYIKQQEAEAVRLADEFMASAQANKKKALLSQYLKDARNNYEVEWDSMSALTEPPQDARSVPLSVSLQLCSRTSVSATPIPGRVSARRNACASSLQASIA